MNKNMLIKGIGIGMALGGTAAYLKGAMMGCGMKRSVKKNMNKAYKSIEGIMGDVRYMFK